MRRLHDIDLKLLRIFRAIVDAGGISGAQLTLNASQSTISTQLADLEKRLGFRLCYRGRAGFSLTKAGQQIYDACSELFSAADQFQNKAASISGELKGFLRLSIVDALISNNVWSLSSVIGSFNQRARNVVIEVSVDSPADMERLIFEGKRDIAIGPFFNRKTGISYHALFQERHGVFCSKSHILASQKGASVEVLKEHAFVARQYLHRYDLERVGHLNPGAVVETMESQAVLIRSGCFIGYLPLHYAESVCSDLHRIQVARNIEYLSPFYLLHELRAEENLVVRNFVSRVNEQVFEKPADNSSDWFAKHAKLQGKNGRAK